MTNTATKLLIAGLLGVVPGIAQPVGTIRVCIAGGDDITLGLLRAEAIASRMFATASVTVEWRHKESAACREAAQSDIVSLEFVRGTSAADHPGALAYSLPCQGSEIVVMLDRVERSACKSSQVSNVLAHTMAHEIAHILQGISRHSEAGVMKARWRPEDFELMTYRPLPFSAEDIALIRSGVARRAGRL